jgi:pyridoxal phosphate enzyme (YggS family)
VADPLKIGNGVSLTDVTQDVAKNLRAIKGRIFAAQNSYASLSPNAPDVTLVAVSKRQPDVHIEAALAAGQRVFGENQVKEAYTRWRVRRGNYQDLQLHLIGPLQTNKVADAVTLFDVIEVVDRPKLAYALAKEMQRQKRNLPCFIQVNTGEEPQKSGIFPREADEFIALCRDHIGLDVTGVMCIPPIDEEAAMHFALLKSIAVRNKLTHSSMGMSNDFEEAIGFGATIVRVGSAIFGTRKD